MSESSTIIYFRTTKGTGDKIILPPLSYVSVLYTKIAQKLHINPNMLQLFIHGKQIINREMQFEYKSGSIVHVVSRSQEKEKTGNLNITINWQNKEYQYNIHSLSTIEHLKRQIQADIGSWNKKIILSYLGREIMEEQSLSDAHVQNNSKLSLCVIPIQQLQGINSFKTHISKSLSFDNQQETKTQPNLLKKSQSSSMLFMNAKKDWFGQKIIQTESINCESQEDDSPDFWLQCQFIAINNQKTKSYTFDCQEEHQIKNIVEKLSKMEKCKTDEIRWEGEVQEMGVESLLQIARRKADKVLGPYAFSIQC